MPDAGALVERTTRAARAVAVAARTATMTAMLVAAAQSAAMAQAANPIEKHGDWTMYAADAGGSRLCFVTAQPTDTKPDGAKRDAIHFYVSAWPKEGVKSEVSVKLGYPAKKGSAPTVSIGTQAFKLFIKDDKAFVADPTAELKLIEAMKKGGKVLVEAMSERGTATSDIYSLSGFDKALQALSTKCS